MKKISIIFFISTCFFVTFCKKEKDIVSTYSISGQVYNLCTDSGLANVLVNLNIHGSSGSYLSTISDHNGNFTFANVKIHSSNDYTYDLSVADNGSGGYTSAINGTDVAIDKNQVNKNFILGVIPHFKKWNLYFPSSVHLTTSDTFILTLQQNVFHKNIPSNDNYQIVNHFPPPPLPQYNNWISALDNYWTGWWYSTLDRTQNGVHIIKTDSFYVGWGATVTDTIPW